MSLWLPLHRWENWGPEISRHLLEITRLVYVVKSGFKCSDLIPALPRLTTGLHSLRWQYVKSTDGGKAVWWGEYREQKERWGLSLLSPHLPMCLCNAGISLFFHTVAITEPPRGPYHHAGHSLLICHPRWLGRSFWYQISLFNYII